MLMPPFFDCQFLDTDGTPLASGLLYTYDTGTTTPRTSYEDQAGASPNTNPIVLDAAGRCNLWLTSGVEYRLVLKRSDASTVFTRDDVMGAQEPGGSSNYVQFNVGGVFTGDADFQWSASTNVMTLGSVATPATIKGTAGTASEAGAALSIAAGAGGSAAGIGGALTLSGGAASATNIAGGPINVGGGAGNGTGARGNVVLNPSGSALTTTAIGGFVMIPTCPGTPTGVPATIPAGCVPLVFDTTGVKLWIYTGGTWKGVVVA